MVSLRPLLLALATAALAGCAGGEAFVDRNYMTATVKKQKLPGYNGAVTVCYDGAAPPEKRDQLAAEACTVYGLEAMLVGELKWQCRLTAPHMATYACVDPKMRMASGAMVNPFSPSQVEAWNSEQKRGKADATESDRSSDPRP